MPQSVIPRNVFIFDANVPEGTQPKLVAGFMQLGHTTSSELYFCLEFCFLDPPASSFGLMNTLGNVLPRDMTIVLTGNYVVVSPTTYISVTLTPEGARPRNISGGSPATASVAVFRERVRARDQLCMVSGAAGGNLFIGQEACHIIPRSHFTYWSNNNMAQHLALSEQGYSIDSVQNGLLLISSLHRFWDCWAMSINPTNMRVVFFFTDNVLQPLFDRRLVQFNATEELPAPPRAFIFEHFRQAVLANMRGAGQPPNLDFDPIEDSQNMAVFESGSGKDWFERELAEKLIAGIDDK